jgi:transposase
MRLCTILNRLYHHKGFVYGSPEFRDPEGGERAGIRVPVRPRQGSRAICSSCALPAPGYDHLPRRDYQFVPLWGLPVFLAYRPRRVACPRCGVKVERLPWARGKERQTDAFAWFLVFWAKLLSWQQVAKTFGVSWATVYAAVEHAVEWGLARRSLDNVTAIGVDEVQWQRGHRYLTLVYQIDEDCKRLLYVGRERTAASLRGFFDSVSEKVAAGIRFVCSDMWQPYLDVLAEKLPGAVHVLDRYHISARLNKAVDEIRASEAKRLKEDGHEPVLKHSRWCFLKAPVNLTEKQTVKIAELLKYNLKTVRAYLHKEELRRLWEYVSPSWASRFLREWIGRVMRSRLEPLKKAAKSMRTHMPLIMNWFEAKGTISAGAVEGMNYKVKLAMKNAYGYRTFRTTEIAFFHKLGKLPESELAHRFV